jgi:hypothetical protein
MLNNYYVLQKHLLSKIYKLSVMPSWALELKVLLILCFYIIIGAAVLALFTRELIVMSKKAIILDYFLCESKGMLPNSNESRCTHLEQSVEEIFNPISSAVAIMIFIGLVPSVNLIYVLKFSDLKSKLRACVYKDTPSSTAKCDPDSECKSTALHRNLLPQ